MNTQTISEQVAESIASAAPNVLPSVVKILADRETDRRAKALLAGIEAAFATKKELTKLERPDIKPNLDKDFKPIGEGWFSEARAKEIKKVRERLAKIEKAIEKATPADGAKPDYNELFNLKSLIEQADKESPAEVES